jgi:hypothetical protein
LRRLEVLTGALCQSVPAFFMREDDGKRGSVFLKRSCAINKLKRDDIAIALWASIALQAKK